MEAEKFFEAASLVEKEKHFEKAARLFVRAAKRFRRIPEAVRGMEAGQKAAVNYAACGRLDTAVLVYESSIKALSSEGYAKEAEIMRRRLARFKKRYNLEKKA